MAEQSSRTSGIRTGVSPEGVGYEIHYSLEQNTKGFNRKMSVGLFYNGGINTAQDDQVLRAVASRSNDVAFEKLNELENKQRRMNNMPLLEVATGNLTTTLNEEGDWT